MDELEQQRHRLCHSDKDLDKLSFTHFTNYPATHSNSLRITLKNVQFVASIIFFERLDSLQMADAMSSDDATVMQVDSESSKPSPVDRGL